MQTNPDPVSYDVPDPGEDLRRAASDADEALRKLVAALERRNNALRRLETAGLISCTQARRARLRTTVDRVFGHHGLTNHCSLVRPPASLRTFAQDADGLLNLQFEEE